MHDLARRSLAFAVATGGLLLTNVGYAMADNASAIGTASGSPGVASGNNAQAPVNAPICVNGNTVSGVGVANSAMGNACGTRTPGDLLDGLMDDDTPPPPGPMASSKQSAKNSPGVLSGNNVSVPIDAPICIGGNAISIVSVADSAMSNKCTIGGSGESGGPSASAHQKASNSPGVLSGNNVAVPVNAPVNVCGNTITIIGVANSAMGNKCTIGGGSESGGPSASAHQKASNSPGVLSGNNVALPINVPVNVCGNTITIIGVANSAMGNKCTIGGSGESGGPSASAHQKASNSPGVLSGNNVALPINVPVNVCGNVISVIGVANWAAGNECLSGSTPTTPTSTPTTPTTTPTTPTTPPTTPTTPPTSPTTPPTSPTTPPTSPTTPPTSPTTPPTTPTTPPTSPTTPPTSPTTPPTSPTTPPTTPTTPPTSPTTPPTSPTTPPTSPTTPPTTSTTAPTTSTTSSTTMAPPPVVSSMPSTESSVPGVTKVHSHAAVPPFIGGKPTTSPPCVLVVRGSGFDTKLKQDGPLAAGFVLFAGLAGFAAGRTTRRRSTRGH